MRKFSILFSALMLVASIAPAQSKLLITEVVVTPTEGEYIEIYNPNGSPVALDNYYLADKMFNNGATDYFAISTGLGTAGNNDFVIRFPAGSTIAAGAYATVGIGVSSNALGGAANFNNTYGFMPTYEVVAGAGDDAGVPNMIETNVSTTSKPGLTNSSESVVIFFWNGATDLVTDIDYLTWGTTTSSKTVKTGISVGASSYLADTAVATQVTNSIGTAGTGFSIQRNAPGGVVTEGAQSSPGNGIAGATDETSEVFTSSFITSLAPSPGAAVPVELSGFSLD